MSESSDMWDRFFRGSKYEWKWLKRGQLAKPISAEAFAERQRRLESDREAGPPTAVTENPFGSKRPRGRAA